MKFIALISMIAAAFICIAGISVSISLIADFFKRRFDWEHDMSFFILLFVGIIGMACVFVHVFYSGIIILMK